MKLCKRCNTKKDDFSFYIRKTTNRPYGSCKECLSLASKDNYINSREKKLKIVKEYRLANIDKIKETKSKYYQENKTDILAKCKEYRESNKEKISEYFYNLWRRSPERRAAHKVVKNNRRIIQERDYYKNLSELDIFIIEEIYDLCQIRTLLIGVKHEVDHIIPLLNPLVCGLHVPANLQIITSKQNRSKTNKFEIVI